MNKDKKSLHLKQRQNFGTGFWALAVVATSAALGCSVFTTKSDPPPEGNAFRATAISNTNMLPVPVEVASDILKISNGEAPSPDRAEPAKGAVATPENAEIAADRGPATDSESCGCEVKPGKGHKKGGHETYTVKPGDTLMKIAFAKYGNLYRWREILAANHDKIKNFNALAAGTVLTINGVEYVVIEHNGEPYLIRRNDTLVKISRSLYGSPQQWKQLWKNNPHLIHDPNKIYAGFTLYYQPETKLRVPAGKPAAAK